MNTYHKISLLVLPFACVTAGIFYYVAAGGPQLNLSFSPGTLLTILAVLFTLIGIFAVRPSRGPRVQQSAHFQNNPPPEPTPDKEYKFHQVKGTFWTDNYASEPDEHGLTVGMFVRRKDGDVRIVEPPMYANSLNTIYSVDSSDRWIVQEYLNYPDSIKYISDWAKAI